jgi:hypothetical protein
VEYCWAVTLARSRGRAPSTLPSAGATRKSERLSVTRFQRVNPAWPVQWTEPVYLCVRPDLHSHDLHLLGGTGGVGGFAALAIEATAITAAPKKATHREAADDVMPGGTGAGEFSNFIK